MVRDLRQDWLVSATEFYANRGQYPARHGTMRLMLYQPTTSDLQQPHKQDELYIIAKGHGSFDKAGEIRKFGKGDIIFVEAGVAHHFAEVSDDTEIWVVFWGPDGGEEGVTHVR